MRLEISSQCGTLLSSGFDNWTSVSESEDESASGLQVETANISKYVGKSLYIVNSPRFNPTATGLMLDDQLYLL